MILWHVTLTHFISGAGVISDIATTAERGGFYGLYSIGPMVSDGFYL